MKAIIMALAFTVSDPYTFSRHLLILPVHHSTVRHAVTTRKHAADNCSSGIGIGIGVRQSFSQNGKASLLSVGILNSISAGILVSHLFRLVMRG